MTVAIYCDKCDKRFSTDKNYRHLAWSIVEKEAEIAGWKTIIPAFEIREIGDFPSHRHYCPDCQCKN